VFLILRVNKKREEVSQSTNRDGEEGKNEEEWGKNVNRGNSSSKQQQ
jgi:hypothetical protein